MSCAVQNRASLRLSCQHGGAQFCKWLACLYQKISKQKRATDGRRGFLPREQPSGRGSTRRAGLIHPFHLAALRRYYRQLIRTRQTDSGEVAVFQGIGDGLVYRGPEVPHWRDRLPDGHTSTSIFFHYVAADFAGPLD